VPARLVLAFDDAIGGGAERLDEAVLAPFLLPALERHAFVEIAAHLEAPAVHLLEHLVWILDQVLESPQELDREAVRPHDDTGMTVQPKDLLQTGQVLDGIVEELVPVLERRALRDDVQEIELVDADR